MSSDNDTNSTGIGTNSDQTSVEFNKQSPLSEKIAAASSQTQDKIYERQKLATDRYAKELEKQKYSRNFRILREENRLLKNYVGEQAPRPNTPEAKAQDLEIIVQDAKRIVEHKEQYHLQQIERQAQADVQYMLQEDRAQSHNQSDHNHDDHGRG